MSTYSMKRILYPQYYTKDLVRLGDQSDGGYILSNKIIKKSDFLLTFGLGDNFRFESDLIKKNPKCKIYVYSKLWVLLTGDFKTFVEKLSQIITQYTVSYSIFKRFNLNTNNIR